MSELAKRFMEHSGKDQYGNLVLLFEDKMIKMAFGDDGEPLLSCNDIGRACGRKGKINIADLRHLCRLATHKAHGVCTSSTSWHFSVDAATMYLGGSHTEGCHRLLEFMKFHLGVTPKRKDRKTTKINTPAPGLPNQDGVEFRKIPGASLYSVGDDGSVWSSRRGVWIKLNPGLDKSGYYCVNIKHDTKEVGVFRYQHKMSVHRLVLLSFKGVPFHKQMACHNNGDKLDNRPENLRWGTAQDNSDDAARHGRTVRGEDAPNAVLDNNAVIAIRELWKRNHTAKEISRLLRLPEPAVSAAAQGKTWKHVV